MNNNDNAEIEAALADNPATTFLIPATPDVSIIDRIQSVIQNRSADAAATAAHGVVCCSTEGLVEVENITCQVRLDVVNWTITCLNLYGNKIVHSKSNSDTNDDDTSGGPRTKCASYKNRNHSWLDEFYVTYHTHAHAIAGNRPIAIARCRPVEQSKQNGEAAKTTTSNRALYKLEFTASPLNPLSTKQGHLSIHFQYTHGLGEMPPPIKNSWSHVGTSHAVYLQRNVPRPPILPFVLPPVAVPWSVPESSSSTTTMRHFAFGDSVLQQLVTADPSRLQIHFANKVRMPLNTNTLPDMLALLQDSIPKECHSTGGMLILNSALWDILSDEATNTATDAAADTTNNTKEPSSSSTIDSLWSNHRDACRQFLHGALRLFPNKTVYWLLPTAVHIQRVNLVKESYDLSSKIQRCRYMSESRTRVLYQQQRGLLSTIPCWCRLPRNDDGETRSVIPLDVYQASFLSGDHTLAGDGRHYTAEWNRAVLSRLFSSVYS